MNKAPIALILLICLNVFGLGLKYIEMIPNKFIPILVVLAGSLGYSFLGNPGSISPDQQHPRVVLGLFGGLIGTAAWLLHNRLLYKLEPLIDKFLPIPETKEKKEEITRPPPPPL